MISPEELFRWLVESLRLLASDYDVQRSVLPPFVHVPDEVALTFGESAILASRIRKAGLIDDDTVRRLGDLRNHLSSMESDKTLWRLESLKDAPDWQRARNMARELLARLGKPLQRPDLSWASYVESRRPRRGEDPLAGIEFDEP